MSDRACHIEWPLDGGPNKYGVKTHQCKRTAGHTGSHVCWCTRPMTNPRRTTELFTVTDVEGYMIRMHCEVCNGEVLDEDAPVTLAALNTAAAQHRHDRRTGDE